MKLYIIPFLLLSLLAFDVKAQCYPDPSQPCWAEENGWYFDNFIATEDLSWDRFRETYIGISEDEFSSVLNFDFIFYEAIYKSSLADKGHCFGMCLLASKMLKYGGELGFCHPPFVYPGGDDGPTQDELRRVIQILHGYQLNHGFILHLLDVLAAGEIQNGNYAYDQMEYYLGKGDPVILSITKSFLPTDGGHSLAAYAVDDVPGSKKRIYVYDTNRTFYMDGRKGRDWYTADSNWVEIDELTGNWSFQFSDKTIYEGSQIPGFGGTIVATPLSIAGVRDRLPQSLFAEVADFKSKVIILGGDVALSQIRTADGKRYFDPNTGGLDYNPETGLKSVLPIIPLNGGEPLAPEAPRMYIVRSDADIEIDIQSTGGEFEAGVLGSRAYAKVSGAEFRGTECIRFSGMNLSTPGLEIVNLANPDKLNVQLMAIQEGASPIRVFDLENIRLTRDSPARMKISGSGDAVEVNSEKPGFSSNVRFYNLGEDRPERSEINFELHAKKQVIRKE